MQPDRQDKRAAVLNSALELFAANGFHASPTSLIAQKAGVGVGTIYRYFKDKDELIRELHRELHTRLRDRVFGSGLDGLLTRERFVLVFTRFLKLFLECPREFRFLEQYYYSSLSHCLEEDGPEHSDVLRLLSQAREEGLLKDAPLPLLKAIAFGPIVAVAKEHSSRRQKVSDETIRFTVEAVWDALKK